MNKFEQEVAERVVSNGFDASMIEAGQQFMRATTMTKYSYNFAWLGRPIIQYPQDMVAMQELIWQVKPDLIIETGIAHGGSLILNASMLALLDMCDATENGEMIYLRQSKRKVLGIDIDIRAHNREAIEAHPMAGLLSPVWEATVSFLIRLSRTCRPICSLIALGDQARTQKPQFGNT